MVERTKWLWVRILWLSVTLYISRLFQASNSLTLRQQAIEFRFTLKRVRDTIIIHSHFILRFRSLNRCDSQLQQINLLCNGDYVLFHVSRINVNMHKDQ